MYVFSHLIDSFNQLKNEIFSGMFHQLINTAFIYLIQALWVFHISILILKRVCEPICKPTCKPTTRKPAIRGT